MRQGEIWWLEQPDHTRRPAWILTRDESLEMLFDVLVAPVTTRQRILPTEVTLGRDDGVPQQCVANVQHMMNVPKSMLRAPLGRLAPGRWSEVCEAVGAVIDC